MGRRKRERVISSNSLSVALREQDTKRIWDILEMRSARITNGAERWSEGNEGVPVARPRSPWQRRMLTEAGGAWGKLAQIAQLLIRITAATRCLI